MTTTGTPPTRSLVSWLPVLRDPPAATLPRVRGMSGESPSSRLLLSNQVNAAQRQSDGHDDGRADKRRGVRKPADPRLGEKCQRREPGIDPGMEKKCHDSQQEERELHGAS